MADPAGRRRLRVLLSEGSSTSAREAITALGLAGHTIEVCDPDRLCLARFSRFVHRLHHCPGLADDPEGFLAFVRDLVTRERFDVLLPIHEQGYLFAKAQNDLSPHVALALPSFEAYAQAHSKAGFSTLLSELGLPQPATTLVTSPRDVRATRFPIVLKSALGTASRGTFIVRDTAELERALAELVARGAFAGNVLIQDFVAGPVEHAQAVFCRGRLVAMHGYAQVARGAGGGPAAKVSVRRPVVRAHLAQIGAHLAWHGALSVDYIAAEDGPRYIDCNPRLVEPMSALLAGLDLTEALLRVSLGETPEPLPDSREGVRTHLAMQALLGCGLDGGSRRDLLAECGRLMTYRGPYAGSREELTPTRIDWPSVLPTAATAVMLLADPRVARRLPERFGSHLLTPRAIGIIQGMPDASPPAFSSAE